MILTPCPYDPIKWGAGTGVQPPWVNGIYLDDQMSNWQVYNNSFYNVSRGIYINGGRLNSVYGNYFEGCDQAVLFGSPGSGHHKGNFFISKLSTFSFGDHFLCQFYLMSPLLLEWAHLLMRCFVSPASNISHPVSSRSGQPCQPFWCLMGHKARRILGQYI